MVRNLNNKMAVLVPISRHAPKDPLCSYKMIIASSVKLKGKEYSICAVFSVYINENARHDLMILQKLKDIRDVGFNKPLYRPEVR